MKFSTAAVFTGLLAFAAAQSSTTEAAASSSATLTAEQQCVVNCGNNVCCQAACVNVPCPDDSMVNATTTCAAQCVQGSGTAADTEAYAKCQQSCISQNFYSNSASLAATASGSGSTASGKSSTATGSSSEASGSSGSKASGSSASGTSSGSAAATSTGAASPIGIQMGASAAGIIGILAAALAL